jgi:hypothetical protein
VPLGGALQAEAEAHESVLDTQIFKLLMQSSLNASETVAMHSRAVAVHSEAVAMQVAIGAAVAEFARRADRRR